MTTEPTPNKKPVDLWTFITVDGLRIPGIAWIPWYLIALAVIAYFIFKKP